MPRSTSAPVRRLAARALDLVWPPVAGALVGVPLYRVLEIPPQEAEMFENLGYLLLAGAVGGLAALIVIVVNEIAVPRRGGVTLGMRIVDVVYAPGSRRTVPRLSASTLAVWGWVVLGPSLLSLLDAVWREAGGPAPVAVPVLLVLWVAPLLAVPHVERLLGLEVRRSHP